jgi:hypothetical protein
LRYRYEGADDWVLDKNGKKYEVLFKDILFNTGPTTPSTGNKPRIPGINVKR